MFKRRDRTHVRCSPQAACETLEARQLLTAVQFVPAVLSLPLAPGIAANDDLKVVVADGGQTRLDVLANDSYYDGQQGYRGNELTVAEVLSPRHGSVRFDETRTALLYTPAPGFEGVDRFLYTARHADGEQAVAEVFVNVVSPLVAVDDWFQIDAASEDNSLDLLRNDQSNAALARRSESTIVSISAASGAGSLAIGEDGQGVSYSPAADFVGLETFSYTVEDADGHRSTATVKLRVTPADQPIDNSSDAWREEVEQFFLEQSLANSAHLFGAPRQPIWYLSVDIAYDFYGPTFDVAVPIAVGWSNASDFSVDGSTNREVSIDDADFSTTNIQEQGVDEGDLVKTDGDFLYVLSNIDGPNPLHEVILVDVRDPMNLTVVSRIAFAERVISQFLDGDRLTVVSRSSDGGFDPLSGARGTGMRVTVLDVSDRSLPEIITETVVEGNLVDARLVGDFLYLVSASQTSLRLPELPRPILVCADGDRGCFYETRTEFLARVHDEIAAIAADFDLPGARHASYDAAGELVAAGQSDQRLSLTDISINAPWQYRPGLIWAGGVSPSMMWYNPRQLTTIFAIDVAADAPAVESGTSIAAAQWIGMYASTDSIYLYEPGFSGVTIHKFDFSNSGGGIEWEASGSVAGNVLNSFSLDEHDGYLRVATHTGNSNSLFVLEQRGDRLELIASIDDLAPGERIYSLRLVGDRGFIVTFRKVDPLFTLDLSDPHEPRLTGQLKAPGYSNYLQLIDDNTLLGIGRNADEQSGLYQGLQASLFDLTDMSAPTLIDRYTFEGGRNTWSPAVDNAWGLSDHHAVSYFDSQQVLALPIFSTNNWQGNYGGVDNTPIFDNPNQSAVRVLHVDPETGFDVLGQVEFDDRASRTVRIGEVLYALSPATIKVIELLRPEHPLGEVVLHADDDQATNPQAGANLAITRVTKTTIISVAPVKSSLVEGPPNGESGSERATYAAEALEMLKYDLDGDEMIGFGDLAILSGQFRGSATAANPLSADFDGSGCVDFGDLSLFSARFGRPAPVPVGDVVFAPPTPADSLFMQIGLEDLDPQENKVV